ncbi:MAG: copper resistance protein CopC [Actinobacteria bacterium]|nr:copper resistance protein CopC [Actinomycetota bacterium]
MRRAGLTALVAAVALVVPAAASAHAYLIKTLPAASVTLETPPPSVQLTYDEAVEPRFATISVTDAAGHSQTTGSVSRSPSNPDTLVVPLRHLQQGWYLVYWRAISVDGHPVQGVFEFAVGPNPGPSPQFTPPHISGSATSTPLVVAKWLAFLTMMAAIGLFVLRMLIARPVIRRVAGTNLHALTVAFGAVAVAALLAIPAYLEEATSIDDVTHSFWDFGALVPLWRITAFGRGYVDVEICFALFCGAAAAAIWVDRPEREHRSVASLLAMSGALAAAGATLLLPGTIGHAGQTAPRGVAVLLDWLHLVSGSVWVGGLIGLLVVWRSLPAAKRIAGLGVCVPRFSNTAFVSVMVLLGTGVGAAVLHLPVLDALWLTSYGKVILIKAGILLAAMLLAAVNLLRTKPGLSRAETSEASARLLRRVVSGEVVLVAGAVAAASVLSSLAPPPPAFAKENSSLATVGPGKVAASVKENGYTLQVLVSPNKAVAPNAFALKVTRGGKPVVGANITLSFDMLAMEMPTQEFQLTETAPGIYSQKTSALVMAGPWALSFSVTPRGGLPFDATIVDHAAG